MRRMLPFILVALFAGAATAFAATHHHHHVGASFTTGSDPVLLGNTSVQPISDGGTNASEAFGYPATVSGTATSISAYLTSTSGVRLGLYSDASGRPGIRLDSGTLASNTAGWVTAPLTAGVQVNAGTRYWIVVAARTSTANVTYRDMGSGAGNLDYSGSGLSSPYATNHQWNSNPASLYVGGTTGSSSSTTTTSTTTSTTSTQTTTSTTPTTSTTTTSTTTASGNSCAGAPGSGTPNYATLDACGYPSPNTTGVPAGTTLTPISQASLPAGASWSSANQELDISGNNITLTGLDINGAVKIMGVNDQINDSHIHGTGNPEVLIYNGGSNDTMSHDDVEAATSTIGAINNAGGTPFTITGSYLHNNCTGVLGVGVTARDNYMITDGNVPGCHVEDAYIPGGANQPATDYEHNTLLNPLGQTAAIFLDNHCCGNGNSNVTENNNLMAGGGYVTYGDSNGDGSSNIVVTNNRFSRLYFPDGGGYGANVMNDSATAWSGNIWDDTLQPVAEDS